MLLKEPVFHWDNIKTTDELLNGHRNHEACEKLRDTTVLEVPVVVALGFDSIIEGKFPEIAAKFPSYEENFNNQNNNCCNHEHLSLS